MNKKVILKGVLIWTLFYSTVLVGQSTRKSSSYWRSISIADVGGGHERYSMPSDASIVRLDLPAIKATLLNAPKEFTIAASLSKVEILVPMPDGSYQTFRMVESEMMEPGLQLQYPNFKVYSGQGIEDPTSVIKVSLTDLGFESMIISSKGQFFIDPFHPFNTLDYVVYEKSKLPRRNFNCETASINGGVKVDRNFSQVASGISNRSSGGTLKTYRLALSCTGEYSAYFGGTASGAMSGIVASTARVNGVYEMELAVRLVLIANDNLLIYLNASTDPYTNNNGSTMLTENQNNITSVIGSANYDIGHVFSTGGGGIAGLGVVCSSTNKARGVTGSSSPTADAYDIDYVAHEMGHQFSGNHTFNSALGSCAGGNRNATTAYEPGSGITIMAYAGICGADDLAAHSIAYFHVKSGDEIGAFITTGTGSTCPVSTVTGNTPPTVAAGTGYNIPISTPFVLTATGSDADGDAITYSWEEYDLGSAGVWNPTSGTAPLFRPFSPTTDPSRTFPKLSDIVNNVTTIGEFPASYARTLNFRVTARDNRAGGGGVTNTAATTVVNVINTTTPFKVTAPNTGLTWTTGSSQTVTWDVSSTNSGTINCSNVKISLSIDGGITYPTILLSSTANDGTELVTVPSILTTTARIKVEAVGNIFFDISNVNFSIIAGSTILTSITTSAIAGNVICSGQALNLSFIGNGNANAGNVYTAQLSNAAGSFSNPVIIGTLTSSLSSGTISCIIPVVGSTATGYRIRVVASNPAVIGADNASGLTYYGTLGATGSISGITTVCQGQTGLVYSISPVTNASGYTWTVPSGSVITAGNNTNSITLTMTTSLITGSITVTPITSCSTGSTSSLSITMTLLPATPGPITGTTSSCANNTLSYSISAVSGASSYSWTFPSGFTIQSGANTNSVTVLAGPSAVTGNITVSGIFACGSGPSSTLAVAIESVAPTPVITTSGSATICNSGTVTLSISAPVVGVNYQWRKNGVAISGATGTTYTTSVIGNYDVLATNGSIAAKIFNNSSRYSIPDASCVGVASVIPVTGYVGTIVTSKLYIKVNITHTYDADLVLFLQSPTGEKLGLSNALGSSGDNFTNTVFADSASAVLPATGAPYTGLYKPSASVFTVTSCTGITTTKTTFASLATGTINPNGNWSLYAYDIAAADTGSIISWEIGIPSLSSTCSSQSNVIGVSVVNSPTVTSFSPTTGTTGTVVSITGSNFTGVTNVKFNGTSATTLTVVNAGLINATVPAGSTTGLITIYNGICSGSSASGFTVVSTCTLNLKVFIQGFYQSPNSLVQIVGVGKSDTVTVQLRSNTSPYNAIYTEKVVLNTTGNVSVSYPGAAIGNSYYIAVSHRNSIETWSKNPVMMTGATNFDFTIPSVLRPAINPIERE